MSFTVCDRVVVGVYSDQKDILDTMRLLQQMNIPMVRTSIVGRDARPLEDCLERYLVSDPGSTSPETWIADLPGLGPFIALGPLAKFIGGVTLADGSGNIAGQMTFDEIAADYYRCLLESRHFLVIVHCTSQEVAAVINVLETCQSINPKSYEFAGADAAYFTPK